MGIPAKITVQSVHLQSLRHHRSTCGKRATQALCGKRWENDDQPVDGIGKNTHVHLAYMVGGWATALKNMKVSWGYYFQYMENKKMFQTTNHQPWTIELWTCWLTDWPLCQVAESWHPPLPRHRRLLWPGINQLSSIKSSGTDWLEYLPYIRPMTFRPIFQAF